MLSARNRFHGHGSLRRVYTSGKSTRSLLIGLKYATRKHEKPFRVAVVVGRKVNKSAVKRNRIRRMVYETVRKSDQVPDSMDLIFVIYSDKILDMPQAELNEHINSLLKSTKNPAL